MSYYDPKSYVDHKPFAGSNKACMGLDFGVELLMFYFCKSDLRANLREPCLLPYVKNSSHKPLILYCPHSLRSRYAKLQQGAYKN